MMNTNSNYMDKKVQMVEEEMKISSDIYKSEFWNKAMRGMHPQDDKMDSGKSKNGMFKLPMSSSREYQAALKKASSVILQLVLMPLALMAGFGFRIVRNRQSLLRKISLSVQLM